MKKVIQFILLLCLVFGLNGCKKNRLKKPAFLSFKMDINRASGFGGNLVFNSGTIVLEDFSIEGRREEGDPISFSRQFSQGLTIPFNPSSEVSELDYDIPQGVYTDLEISFDTYDDNVDETIIVEGSYTNSSAVTHPVRFEFMSAESFSIEGEDFGGTGKISLEKDTNPIAFIKLDPIYWFQPISTSAMDGADLVNVGGTMTILINEDENSTIYDVVADRVDESTEAVFTP